MNKITGIIQQPSKSDTDINTLIKHLQTFAFIRDHQITKHCELSELACSLQY